MIFEELGARRRCFITVIAKEGQRPIDSRRRSARRKRGQLVGIEGKHWDRQGALSFLTAQDGLDGGAFRDATEPEMCEEIQPCRVPRSRRPIKASVGERQKPFCDRTEARKGTSSNRLVTGKWKKISEALNWNEIYYTKLRTANWISSFSVRSCRGDNTSRLWDTADIPNKINKLFFNWYPPWIFYAQPKSRKKIPSSMRTSVVSLMYKYWHLATSENQVMYYWVGRRCNCV